MKHPILRWLMTATRGSKLHIMVNDARCTLHTPSSFLGNSPLPEGWQNGYSIIFMNDVCTCGVGFLSTTLRVDSLLFVSGLPQSVYKDLDHNTRSLFAPAQLVSFPLCLTKQSKLLKQTSGIVAAPQATLSVPAATAQVSSAAPAAEQETLEVHICFLVNFLYFMPSCSFAGSSSAIGALHVLGCDMF